MPCLRFALYCHRRKHKGNTSTQQNVYSTLEESHACFESYASIARRFAPVLQHCSILINNGIEQKKSDSFRDLLLRPRAVMKNNVFICFTCINCISKNTLPKLSIANNNAIGCLPDDLLDVTDMEVKLCSFVVPKLSFQTVRGGGQAQVNSHSILFDSPVVAVAQTLPRLDAVDLIRVITTTSIARCVPIHKSLKFVEVRVPKYRKLLQFFSKHMNYSANSTKIQLSLWERH